MPLNKLDNFIKNTEGRILYVSPSDLDSSDSIDNTGNSLARPFKTIQRAILESARFSYVKGNSNDLIEKTTILLMPGEHIVDNRPGFYIKDVSGSAVVVSRSGASSATTTTLDLNLNTNFDLTQEDNILYKFNSVNGGVIVPRGTSIVGLDLRKTKIRPNMYLILLIQIANTLQSLELLVLAISGNSPSLMETRTELFILIQMISLLIISQNQSSLTTN